MQLTRPKAIAQLIFLLFTLLLTGCGFHLRGYEPLPPQLHILYLETSAPFSPFNKQLRQTLRSMGICFVTCVAKAPITLQLLDESFSQTTTSVSSGGQVTTYLLTQTISYQLKDLRGNILQGPQCVSTSRSYSISSSQILGDTSALENLRMEMERDVVYQLLNHLRSPSTLQAIQSYTCNCATNN